MERVNEMFESVESRLLMAVVDYYMPDDATITTAPTITVEAGSTASGGGGGAGKVSMNDFHFVMRSVKASVSL